MMNDQELIARLRDLGDHAAFKPHMHHKAADRIEQLMKERDEERTKRKMAEGLVGLSSADIDGHSAMITVARDAVAKRMAAEAKLAKARTGLRKIADHKHFVAHLGWTQNAEARIASATLAELEMEE